MSSAAQRLRVTLICASALILTILGTTAAIADDIHADLSLTKEVNDANPNVGENVTFTVTLTNQGPHTATTVTVTDQLPSGLTFVSATASLGAYVSGIWTVDTLAALGSATLQITATVATPDPRTNTAIVTFSDQTDTDPTDNSASATVSPTAADLALTKGVSDPNPDVGEVVAFTVTLTNQGPDTATNVTVTDLLPAGLTFASATPSQGTYTPATGIWTVGTVATASPKTLQITATVVAPGSRTNTATITDVDQFDPDTANNTASATVSPTSADLALTKTVNDANPDVGDQVAFTVTLTNQGPDTATNVTVIDLLPAGLTFVSATPSQGTYTPATGIWTVGTVATASPKTLQITATVVSPNARTNTATVADVDQFDPNTANNTASATVSPTSADLALTKTVNDANPDVGDQVAFTVTLTNQGPDTATNVTVTDLLPAGLTFVSATPSQGTYTPATGIWTVGTVATASPKTLQITATVVTPNARTNTATVTDVDQFDPNTANNSASATVSPTSADLALSKTVNDPTPDVGDQIAFTVTLTNQGPDTATNVTVTDLLPAGLTFVTATLSQGLYNPATGVWTVGTVAVGPPATLQITATVIATGQLINTATVTDSDQFDPDTSNNSATRTLSPGSADLALTKTVSDANPDVGDQVVFTVTLTNQGPDTATNVAVTDLLPAGLTFVSATLSQGAYNPATGLWTVGTLGAGPPATLQITATVVSVSQLTNTATVTASDQFDPNVANNSATAVVTARVATPSPSTSSGMPRTGFGATGVVAAGVLLVLGGAALVAVVAWRRRRTDRPTS